MYAFQRFLEINNFLFTNELIYCEFFLLKNNFGGEKMIFYKKKKKKIPIQLPFWMAKIFNVSSFCKILIPLCFSSSQMKNFFNETKNFDFEFFSGKFFFLGLKLAQLSYKKISKKILKSLFLKRFSELLRKIRGFFLSKKKKKSKSKNFGNIENFIFSNLTGF
ncbi:hypothetical protein HAN_2g232 (nucleomorph) [Hemiselmis andersenii]|uniref:Uncharacterized protein n=1 Tax=Hemiselmis andersenii TaxID=464988 RepID=A9BKQ3_HEMAN|nr:hypothetical protein HAN_2g232 [Hemiselmis andersenii]ABW98058.1 hypothetical protein HAN_2g232 [Hemiselmis andersenii]